tara:strand:+ start:822 stop:1214 length:393 start_codon:yes stop_codon:yes gene_type:complete
MSNERNLYKMVREKLKDFNPIRIETSTINGFPDLILFNKNRRASFIECKVCERDKLIQSLRPHQKSFHHKFSSIFDNLFILQRSLKERSFSLYRSRSMNFLEPKTTSEPLATVPLGETWQPIREILNNDH